MYRTKAPFVVRIWFGVCLVAGLTLIAQAAFARGDCDVHVDCSTHVITVLGQQSRIDCGRPNYRNQSHNGVGRIGGWHDGTIIHNGIRIEGIPGMGDSGGGKVFHARMSGQSPAGLNSSSGCIHVSVQTRDVLHQCQGSRLEITGAGAAARPPLGSVMYYTRRGHRIYRHRRQYFPEDEYPSAYAGYEEAPPQYLPQYFPYAAQWANVLGGQNPEAFF